MGYAHYTVYRNGQQIEAGYSVGDVCNQPNCTTDIDRGMAYLCGGVPGGDEWGCGHYFCDAHLYLGIYIELEVVPYLCAACTKVYEEQLKAEEAASATTPKAEV